jgi:hypothetical protein
MTATKESVENAHTPGDWTTHCSTVSESSKKQGRKLLKVKAQPIRTYRTEKSSGKGKWIHILERSQTT